MNLVRYIMLMCGGPGSGRHKGISWDLFIRHHRFGVVSQDVSKGDHSQMAVDQHMRKKYDEVIRGTATIDHDARTIKLDHHPENDGPMPYEVDEHFENKYPGVQG